jgi:hypothetical protein
MSPENDIQNALFERVKGLSWPLDIEVVWPNRNFPGPDAQARDLPKPPRYLRVWPLPNRPDRLFIGSDAPHRRLGILQLSLFMPLNQGDIAKPIADQIADHFATDTMLTRNGVSVRITSAPFIRNGRPEPAHWHTPIEIPYEAFA